MYKIGDKLKISSDNDNENYDEYRDEILVVSSFSTSINDHPGYDESMDGMALYDLELLNGEYFPFSLYEYELEYA